MAKKSDYSADNIKQLKGLEAVRVRPGMYIGSTGFSGLHHILWEIVDNSVDEAINGHADEINVTLHNDGSVSVKDNGRGIPVDVNSQTNLTGVEMVFTILHAGGKFDDQNYTNSGGLHGVGASVTNALSEWLEVEVIKNGNIYYQKFHLTEVDGKLTGGVPFCDLKIIGKSKGRGTTVRFKPDPIIFDTVEYDLKTIKKHLRESSFLFTNITMNIVDEREVDETGKPYSVSYCSQNGLIDYINHLNNSKSLKFPDIVYLSGKRDRFQLDITFQYTTGDGESIYSYVNNIRTPEGGTHETGFRTAMTRAFNEFIKDNNLNKKDNNLQGEDFRDGVTAILSLKMPDPQFEGQTKAKLGSSDAKAFVESIFYELFSNYLKDAKNKKFAAAIIKSAEESCRIREAEKRAKETEKKKNSITGSVLMGKFSASIGKKAERNEIFIVEGDSAGGTARQARDKSFQAVLSLRGKPQNVQKKSFEEVMKNEEFQTILYALGTDIDDKFDINKLKYNKIIILADADQDGGHIRSIMLTFFFKYMPNLIREGKVYIGMPPLYKVEKKGSFIKYAYDGKELDEILKTVTGNYHLQRYKGLGEMNPDQLWTTALNPATRVLTKVMLDDFTEAQNMVVMFMGKDAEGRRNYIFDNANFNKIDKFSDKYGE